MSGLRNELKKAFHEGNFLQVVYEKSLGESGDQSALVEELISMHNDGIIDAITCFSHLENKLNIGYNFFLTRRIFEKTLPQLNAPVKPVMDCVLHLVHEADQDMAASSTFVPFIDFCANDPSRPEESLRQIEAAIEQLADLITPTIVAGARIDFRYYLNEAIRLTSYDNIEIRKRAVYSLGRIQYPQDSELYDSAIACLELSVAKEIDDHLLGNLIRSAFSLYIYDKSKEDRAIALINNALSKGGNYSLHAASELVGFYFNDIPESLLDSLFNYLRRVRPENKRTLYNIEHGIIKLINCNDPTKGIEFIEAILTANQGQISMETFDMVIRKIHNNINVLNKLMTRWFLRGNRILCEGIRAIVNKNRHHCIKLEIDPSELISKDQLYIIFLARKAIGYLFLTPITVVSVIISLMHNTNEDGTIQKLSELLLDPLLINFPGKVKDYLMEKAESEAGKIKSTIETAIKAFDEYLRDLESTGVITELHPTQTQRNAYRRHFSQLMLESFKKAEEESVLLSIVSRSILLYGRKSIDYVYGPDGKPNRVEIPLHSHGTEMEFPRLEKIDCFGLNYMIQIWRAEQIKT